MIGRAAIGNPWIFSRRDRETVTQAELRQVMVRHLKRMMDFHGEKRGLILFRKHALQYLKTSPLELNIRQSLVTSEEPEEIIQLLERIL